ncbi:hypothetical protein DINM_003312 [Dirofilaria immitis]|nr:hypothetical protein [Dirofilaria immitis]
MSLRCMYVCMYVCLYVNEIVPSVTIVAVRTTSSTDFVASHDIGDACCFCLLLFNRRSQLHLLDSFTVASLAAHLRILSICENHMMHTAIAIAPPPFVQDECSANRVMQVREDPVRNKNFEGKMKIKRDSKQVEELRLFFDQLYAYLDLVSVNH